MKAFTHHHGIVAPLDRSHVDTDALIPKQFIKSIRRDGFGDNLFDEWRYLDHGEPGQDCSARPRNPEFVLNQARYQAASVLLSRENFGCGSSREHAVWALENFGFRCVIASSFADIFKGNCFKNGLLPIQLSAAEIDTLFNEVLSTDAYALNIDLSSQSLQTPQGRTIHFSIDAHPKHCLLHGLDDIALTLEKTGLISAYEEKRKRLEPWLF